MTRRILLVEDDLDLADLARLHLEDQGWVVEVVHDGRVGAARAAAGGWDLIVLDLMLPGVDGLEICRQVRAAADYTPVLVLTARSTEVDRVRGLELGADDYLTKPASFRELVARVKALLRRADAFGSKDASGEHHELGGIAVNVERREVRVDGCPVALTAREFDLLLHFARHPGRVFRRSELLDRVWGLGYEGYEHTVNSHINRLRSKIEEDPSQPTRILTVWGVGYKLSGEGHA